MEAAVVKAQVQGMADAFPNEVEALRAALSRLPGVYDVRSGLDRLEGLAVGDLAMVKAGHLPHATLRRTEGGLQAEAMVQFEFRLQPRPESWRTLEFLAWFVRDEARGGEYLQLRPFGLSPRVGDTVQLGRTLGFHLELFCEHVGKELGPVLAKVQAIADDLNTAIDAYSALLNAEVDRGDSMQFPSP